MIGSDLFADPAWDMLLALYAADLADKRLNAAEICSAAAVSLSTAQRWSTALEEHGIVRTNSPFLSGNMTLLPAGSSVMSRYFSAVSTTILPF